jgi:hypothetical protein
MCAGPLVLVAIDAAVTLLGQTPEYWAGGWDVVREHNPLAYWLLRLGPGAFCLGVVLWAGLVVAAVHLLPVALARGTAFCVMFGHALAATTWLLRWHFGIILVVGLFLLVRTLDNLIKE